MKRAKVSREVGSCHRRRRRHCKNHQKRISQKRIIETYFLSLSLSRQKMEQTFPVWSRSIVSSILIARIPRSVPTIASQLGERGAFSQNGTVLKIKKYEWTYLDSKIFSAQSGWLASRLKWRLRVLIPLCTTQFEGKYLNFHCSFREHAAPSISILLPSLIFPVSSLRVKVW